MGHTASSHRASLTWGASAQLSVSVNTFRDLLEMRGGWRPYSCTNILPSMWYVSIKASLVPVSPEIQTFISREAQKQPETCSWKCREVSSVFKTRTSTLHRRFILRKKQIYSDIRTAKTLVGLRDNSLWGGTRQLEHYPEGKRLSYLPNTLYKHIPCLCKVLIQCLPTSCLEHDSSHL